MIEVILAFSLKGINTWFTGTGIALVLGIIGKFLFKKGWTAKIKKALGFMEVITEEIGEFFLASSDVFEKVNKAIKADGKIDQNSIKEIIEEGKEAILEWKDVVMIIKPKV